MLQQGSGLKLRLVAAQESKNLNEIRSISSREMRAYTRDQEEMEETKQHKTWPSSAVVQSQSRDWVVSSRSLVQGCTAQVKPAGTTGGCPHASLGSYKDNQTI